MENMEWCEAEGLLSSLYCFSHCPPSSLQSAGAISSICNIFTRFVKALEGAEGSALWPALSSSDLLVLKQAVSCVASGDSASWSASVTWFGEYGCSLLALRPPEGHLQASPSDIYVSLVGLDDWNFSKPMHSTADGAVHHSAQCDGSVVLPCGTVETEAHSGFLQTLHALLSKAQTRKEGSRSAAGGRQGHQKTPAFIRALALQALEQRGAGGATAAGEEPAEQTPHGGFTDVGMHTGGLARDTAWPLVRETLRAVMGRVGSLRSSTPELFEQLMAHLHLWLLQRQVRLVQPATATSLALNAVVQMLQATAGAARELAEAGYDVAHFLAACRAAKQELETAAAERARATALRFQLPVLGGTAASPCGPDSYRLPSGVIPSASTARNEGDGLEEAKQRAARNLGSLPLPSEQPGHMQFSALHALLQSAELQGSGDTAAQHALCMVEREMFLRAAQGFGAEAALVQAEVDALAAMVDAYRKVLHRFMGSDASSSRMRTDLVSREVLVGWVAFCMIHAAARRKHPLLQSYGVGLDWDALRHLVLTDRTACDAMLSVAAYLQRNTVPGKAVFTLADGGAATWELAERYAQQDGQMQDIWRAEQAAAEARRQAHWQEVQRKQRLVADLRTRLAREKVAEDAAREEWQQVQDRRRFASRGSFLYNQLQVEVENASSTFSQAQAQRSRTESALRAALQSPTPVIQPLPRGSQAAHRWIFFLYTPSMLRQLMRMSFLAQQLLVPRPPPMELVGAPEPKTHLVDHYNLQQHTNYLADPGRRGSEGAVRFVSNSALTDKVALANVDCYTSSDDGIWHPDSLQLRMGWQGSGSAADVCSSWHNPFAPVPNKLTVEAFTEQLPIAAAVLQWAMPQYGSGCATTAERGNLGIARQDLCSHGKIDFLTKPGFLAFCALRSYPLTQLRQLCMALHERLLPLGHPAILTLFRQALYHAGTLAGAPQPALLWRSDWEQGGMLSTLCQELSQLAAELANAPREHMAALLLGEVAAYLSAWHPPLREVARAFAAMAVKWAEAQEPNVLKAMPAEAGPLRAKQCLLRMIALACYGAGGAVDTEDAQRMLSLAVQIRHGYVHGHGTPLEGQLAELQVICHWTLARHVDELVRAAEQKPALLTTALDLVLKQREPAALRWRRVELSNTRQLSASFQADDGRHLYSINFLDGTLLMDGRPPGRLPSEIRGHSLYQRCFGDWDFEVSFTSEEVHVTLCPVKERFYEFSLAPNSDLVVVEREGGRCLQLLDVGRELQCGAWGGELPVRLRELHSHWLCRKERAIVLRPPDFRKHSVHFILQWDGSSPVPGGEQVLFACLRVPPHLRQENWAWILVQHGKALTDQLVLHTSGVADVLGKFEQPEYIHTYINALVPNSSSIGSSEAQEPGPPREMLFELPRFRLEFELRGATLASIDYAGYSLHPCQQLFAATGPAGAEGASYTLPDFTQYLVLQQGQHCGAGTAAQPGGHIKVLVPLGEVERSARSVAVKHATSSGAKIKVHSYDVHPRLGHLCSNSDLGRLQLAALYAASSSLIPEPQSYMTGAQIAMGLLRQSWGVRPLEPAELQQLHSIPRLGGHLAAGLRLLAFELQASASQLNSLHFPDGPPKHAEPPACDPDWGLAYLQEQGPGGYHNPRLQLTAGEEQRVLGQQQPAVLPPVYKRLQRFQEVEVPECPVAACVVPSTEAMLQQLVVCGASGRGCAAAPPYPLSVAEGCLPLEREMHAELKDSWKVHHEAPVPTGVVPGAKERIMQVQAEVQQQRQRAEEYLSTHLSWIPDSVGIYGTSFKLLQASAAAPLPALPDLMRLALQSQAALKFNPFLSMASQARLQRGARTWLQLCVLEDRLRRLALLAEDPLQEAALIQELQVHREWSVDEHPEWLVFEAEGQLQIRPMQYWVARYLISHPSSAIQLNMGEGKTRVIIPMLILFWDKGKKLVRTTLLPQLLEEAYAHLHTCLCASVLARKLFVQPFHRDVRVAGHVVTAMRSALAYCKQEGGVLLTTPERRLSLLLKRQELYQQGKAELCAALDTLDQLPFVDILDESDELLSHKYQLIYAWGSPIHLPSEQARARAVQALMHILSSAAHSQQDGISATLAREGVAVWAPPSGKPGGFQGLRLLPGEALQAALPLLRRQLVEALMEDPPYALRWMKGHSSKERLVECIVDPAVDASPVVGLLDEEEGCDVLALRGLLACGVLEHCLKMRHLVDFGVNRSKSARKRLAVPFRAAHVPSERSEYAQPDTALALATLSYYMDGLSPTQLLEALRALLRLGPNAQKAFYSEWWQLLEASPEVASGAIPPGDLEVLDSISKLDATNAQQMELMHRLFSHNMGAVDFFLNTCVFPSDTRQFPQRLVATAWHLAESPGGHVVGFSGTNDNHRLLPLQVRQHLEVEPSLRATNGKMLELLLDNPQYDTLLVQGEEPTWKALLRFAAANGLDALIDCGALLAGTSNRGAAEFLLSLLDRTRHKAVCYFDEKDAVWVVWDLQGRRMPRATSPIRESQAFTLFDEARCRGADLQLRLDAVALLTLGPATAKDKLMQAAGRLRKLGKGQRLRTIGTADVTAKIRRAATAAGAGAGTSGPFGPSRSTALTSRDVLQWVMANTVQATLRGVMEWGHQGLLFASTHRAPDHALLPEVLELAEMYAASRRERGVGEVVREQSGRRRREGMEGDMVQLMAEVVAHSEQHGAGHLVVAQGGLGEECERELEREEEEEEEVEREVAQVEPAGERDWHYAKALGAQSVHALEGTDLALLPLAVLMKQLQPEGLAALPWSPGVFCTRNFANTVLKPPSEGSLNEYLRPVGSLLLLPSKEVVLLSERECNGLLEVLWQRTGSTAGRGKAPAPLLASLCYACKAQPQAGAGPALPGLALAVAARSDGSWAVPGALEAQLRQGDFMEQLVSLQLFNGETTFVEVGRSGMRWEDLRAQGQLRLLSGMMGRHGALAEALVGMRGKQIWFQHSQLELACNKTVQSV